MRLNNVTTRQAGFSLVELMVGLVIGLLATLVIMQTFSAFEGQKRSTTGTADAQTNGTIALMHIQRHIQTAGYGLPMPNANFDTNVLRCTNLNNIFPVEISDGANGNAGDSITVRYSTSAAGAVPIEIMNPSGATATPGMVVTNNIGCGSDQEMSLTTYESRYRDPSDPDDSNAPNNVMIFRGNTCATAEIAEQPKNTGSISNIRLASAPAALSPLGVGDMMACMGNYRDYVIDVQNNELRVNGRPVVSEVVSVQAQYGVSNAAGNNEVTNWVDAAGAWATPSVTERNRIKAVRVALVLRNGLKEKTQVTTAAPELSLWTTGGATTTSMNISHLPDWQNYRYRVFGTTVPLRNVIWSREAVQ